MKGLDGGPDVSRGGSQGTTSTNHERGSAMSMIAAQIAELAAAAQDGQPAARWAVLQELAVASAIEGRPLPDRIDFDDQHRETVHGMRPTLTLRFGPQVYVEWWLGWFGYITEDDVLPLGTYSMLWRGWTLAVVTRDPS